MEYGRLIGRYVTAMTSLLLFMGVPGKMAFAATHFFLERPKLGMDFSYDYESEKRDGPYIQTRDIYHAFREKLDIETGGWIYHPALLTHTIRLSPEWEQMSEQAGTADRRTRNSFLAGYSLYVTLLQEKPYTVNLFASRDRYLLKSSFAKTSKTETDIYGTSLSLKYKALPTLVSYSRTASVQTGFYESDEVRDEVRLNMRHDESSNITTLNAAHTERDRTTMGNVTKTKNSDAYVLNTYRITPDNRILLNSSLSGRRAETAFLSKAGPLVDQSTSGISLTEALNWRHAKNFSTNYLINYNRDSIGESRSERRALSAGLSHLLYENLITTASLNASDNTFTGGTESVSGGILNFDYRRNIPRGMVSAYIGLDYRVTRNSVTELFLDVIDESHILRTGEVTLLNKENAELTSIVVTDTNRSILYIQDVDYRLEMIGALVRISRTSFGGIADGQTVLVSYRYLSNPAFDYSTFSRSYGAGLYLWSAWRINYRYNQSRQTFLAGIPPAVLNNDTTHTADTDLTWRWTTTRIVYENSDRASGYSFTRWLATESLAFKPRGDFFLGLSGHVGQTTFKYRNEVEDLSGVRVDAQWMFTKWGRINIQGFYEKITGSMIRIEDKGVSTLLEWFSGIWSGDISYRFLIENDMISGMRLDRHSVFFRIKRTLF